MLKRIIRSIVVQAPVEKQSEQVKEQEQRDWRFLNRENAGERQVWLSLPCKVNV